MKKDHKPTEVHAAAIGILGILLALTVTGCGGFYHGPVSDHFDGKSFYNKEPDHGFADHVKWLWEMKTIKWPEWIDDPAQPKPPAAVAAGDLRVTYISQATVLIQTDGLNILTDPIWSERAGPVSWAGPKRVRAPGVKLDDLPRIDIILISHDHYDHLDHPTLKSLTARDKPLVIAGLGMKKWMHSNGFDDVVELDWWQTHSCPVGGLRVTFVPALHQSGRGMLGNNKVLWGGFVIEGTGGKIYFAGDTGYSDFLDTIHERFPEFRLSILPIGSYEKRWFMKNQHMNPADAVAAHRLLQSRQSVGMHFGTFSEHAEQTIDQHERDLAEALRTRNVSPSEFWILNFGEGRDVGK